MKLIKRFTDWLSKIYWDEYYKDNSYYERNLEKESLCVKCGNDGAIEGWCESCINKEHKRLISMRRNHE